MVASAAAVMFVLHSNATLGDQVHGKAPLTPFRIPVQWLVLNEGHELHTRVRIHGSWQAQPMGTGVSAMQARLDPRHCMHTYTHMSHTYICTYIYIYIHMYVCKDGECSPARGDRQTARQAGASDDFVAVPVGIP